MSEKEPPISRTASELFGSFAAAYGEAHGLDKYFRVANCFIELVERIEKRGLKFVEIEVWDDKLYAVYREGQTFGESFPLQAFKGENEGIWVSDIEAFDELIGLEDANK